MRMFSLSDPFSALRFEWAWQHPGRSRRLNGVPAKKRNEKLFNYHIRLLGEMLLAGPWCRLPLTIRWLRPELKGDVDFQSDRPPPIHMPIVYGQVKSINLKQKLKRKMKKKNKDGASQEEAEEDDELLCGLCVSGVPKVDQVQCISTRCSSIYHLICLAAHFRQTGSEKNSEFFIPVDGQCPVCDRYMFWGDIIRKKKGCYEDLEEFGEEKDEVEVTTEGFTA